MQRLFEVILTKKIGLILLIMCLGTFYVGLNKTIAADFVGAEEIISQVNLISNPDNKQNVKPHADAADILRRDLEYFKTVRSKLPIDESVDRWLKLYDRFWSLPAESLTKIAMSGYPFMAGNKDKLSLDLLIASIPPPSTWRKLKDQVLLRKKATASYQEEVLRIIAFYLNKDDANLKKSLSELKTNVAFSNGQLKFLLLDLNSIIEKQDITRDKQSIDKKFTRYIQSLQAERPEGRFTVLVPDLVSAIGEEKAGELIMKAIAIPGLSLKIPSAGKTLLLAKRLVKENSAKLVGPQWKLITSFDDTELYEIMDKRFPEKESNKQTENDIFRDSNKYDQYNINRTDDGRLEAKINYILGLIAHHREKEAFAKAKRMEPEDFESSTFIKKWQSFDKIMFVPELMQFCNDTLTERPELPLWKQCGLVAVSSKTPQSLIDIAASAAKKTNISLESKFKINERQVELLLTMDRVDDAVKLLNDIIHYDSREETSQIQMTITQIQLNSIKKMVKLGKLLERPELIRQSVEIYKTKLRGAAQPLNYQNYTVPDPVIGYLIEAGEYTEAEKLVMLSIQSFLKMPELSQTGISTDMFIAGGTLLPYLSYLVKIYDHAGRYEDVIILMENAPWWGATDLISLAEKDKELLPVVARALHQVHRDHEAVAILESYLYGHAEDDVAYRVLIDIKGPALIPWLDELYKRDQFEERPLIWKAELLRRQGKFDEAEIAVRQALKIDPTDGEQKAEDRGRAYTVLAQILKAKGKNDDALFFENVVSAIRIAEKGDENNQAGLIGRSIALYKEASKLFIDAYCVQWRLAERLSAMGNLEEATKHYEIAFQRLPEQFGQVASFCFGCEGVFYHQQSRHVAERVLTDLTKIVPQKPQVHFLLGQLREAQGRKAEAYQHFRKAAEIDPNYLDALKEAYSLRSDVFLTQAETNEIALKMIRLDPLNHHAKLDQGEISDVANLWHIYDELGKNNIKIPPSLLVLKSSKENIYNIIKKAGYRAEYYENWLSSGKYEYLSRIITPEPGDAVAKNYFIQRVLQLAMSNVTMASLLK